MPSTAIRSFTYDADRRELYVTFTSGTNYTYFDVPPEIYEDWLAAFSKGSYFAARVRDRYRYARRQ
ncbi:MAG: hypothetical protein NVSMB26_03840 [Beijerinckiaceae bacterium]